MEVMQREPGYTQSPLPGGFRPPGRPAEKIAQSLALCEGVRHAWGPGGGGAPPGEDFGLSKFVLENRICSNKIRYSKILPGFSRSAGKPFMER